MKFNGTGCLSLLKPDFSKQLGVKTTSDYVVLQEIKLVDMYNIYKICTDQRGKKTEKDNH